MDIAVELGRQWYAKGYVAGALIDVNELVRAVESIISLGNTAVVPTMAVVPRVPRNDG